MPKLVKFSKRLNGSLLLAYVRYCLYVESNLGATVVQGVIKSYDPGTKDGVVMSERNFTEYELAPNALEGSIFRMLRQGQRVIFELDDSGMATKLRLGSEVDMGTPDFLQ